MVLALTQGKDLSSLRTRFQRLSLIANSKITIMQITPFSLSDQLQAFDGPDKFQYVPLNSLIEPLPVKHSMTPVRTIVEQDVEQSMCSQDYRMASTALNPNFRKLGVCEDRYDKYISNSYKMGRESPSTPLKRRRSQCADNLKDNKIRYNESLRKRQIKSPEILPALPFTQPLSNANSHPYAFRTTNFGFRKVKLANLTEPTSPELKDIPAPPEFSANFHQLKSKGKEVLRFLKLEEDGLLIKRCSNGIIFYKSGKAVVYYQSGSAYWGGWNQRKHGQGIQIRPNQFTFQGSFNKGRKHGKGVMWLPQRTIVGEWQAGELNGESVEWWQGRAEVINYKQGRRVI